MTKPPNRDKPVKKNQALEAEGGAILGIYYDRNVQQQFKEWKRINELCAKFSVSRSRLARISLKLGLTLIEKDPLLILMDRGGE